MFGIKHPYLLAALAGLMAVYYFGLQVDIMDVDAAQYAYMSQDMQQSGEYLQVQYRGTDYLDKPPLLFWLSSLSFSIFGVSNWAYKLPSLLFSLLGLWATYRFAALYYSKQTAALSALFLATCQALILVNNDVRTDTLLLGALIFAIWQLSAYLQTGQWKWLLGGSVGIALAMLAKGPIGLMVPVLAFGADWLSKRQWANFFKWQWLVVVVVVGILLAPMLYGLYLQHGGYGPYFYFWAQSFGRLTGDNPFINSGLGKQEPAPFFFVHTFLWAMIPWALLSVLGLLNKLYAFVKNGLKVAPTEEVITLWGFILPFIALSMSEYKLPHYIFILLPFGAIMAARYVDDLVKGRTWSITAKTLTAIQKVLGVLLVAVAAGLASWSFPVQSVWLWLAVGALVILLLFSLFERSLSGALLSTSLLGIVAANLVLNAGIYPQILQYQSTSLAGKTMRELGTTTNNSFTYQAYGQAINFYAGHTVPHLSNDQQIQQMAAPDVVVYTSDKGAAHLAKMGYAMDTLKAYQHHNVTLITGKFLNPEKRQDILKPRYLLKMKGNE